MSMSVLLQLMSSLPEEVAAVHIMKETKVRTDVVEMFV